MFINTRAKGALSVAVSNIIISAIYYFLYGRKHYAGLYYSYNIGIIVFSIAISYLLFDKFVSKNERPFPYAKILKILFAMEIVSVILSTFMVSYIYGISKGSSNYDAIGGAIIYLTWTILMLILGIPVIVIFLIIALLVFVALEKYGQGLRA
jgi:hypothetical protein